MTPRQTPVRFAVAALLALGVSLLVVGVAVGISVITYAVATTPGLGMGDP